MIREIGRGLLVALAVVGLTAGAARASTIAQNSAWNITRPGSTQTYGVVAYGDSIFAGYTSATNVARRGAPLVTAEYLAALSGQRVEVRRRCQSGAVASGVYSRINSAADRAFMQNANTRMVMFEMCGNDYLQARSSFRSASGTCNYSGLQTALANCVNFTGLAMQNINQFAHANTEVKMVMNLYYPGFNADDAYSTCTDAVNGDPANGNRVHMQTFFLPLLAESNWQVCKLAEQHGFECGDAFATYMARDYDSNGDGIIDSDAIRYLEGESLAAYKARIVGLKGTLRDSNLKLVNTTTTFDYLQSDDTHPTFEGVTASTLLTTPGGDVPVFFATTGAYPDGKNPHWDWNGHDRLGWLMDPTATFTPPACGNGAVETVWLPSGTPRDEPCDDGNDVDGDGCTSQCEVETGYACSGAPSLCGPICGDGLIVGGEGCDDGNDDDSDGCASTCFVEDGWSCAGELSACAPICGDGLIRGTEECDDAAANGTAASCCTGTCTFQPSGAECDDGLICTDNVCDGANTCVATPRSCDDGNACTTDTCNETNGCVQTPNGDPTVYDFGGFQSPIEGAPVFNVGQAGRTYPVKFQLPRRCTSGYIGRLDAVTYNPIRMVQVSCDSTLPADPIEETSTAGNTELRYNAGAQQYMYNWKTSKDFADKCYQLVIELDNGQSPYALFRFKK